MAKKKEMKEKYLKIPNSILNISGLNLNKKNLLAHIYSYGRKGCWQGNDTLGKMFYVSGRTISTWVSDLKKAGEILWAHPKGRYRTLWAKRHPDIKTATSLLYMGEEISKEAVVTGHATEILLRRNLRGGIEETGVPTTKKHCIQVRRNLLHTNNTTKKDTTTNTTATPSPLPAGGQAPALLVDRKNEYVSQIEQLKKSFGSGGRRRKPELTAAEREQRRQAQLKALQAVEAGQQGLADGKKAK